MRSWLAEAEAGKLDTFEGKETMVHAEKHSYSLAVNHADNAKCNKLRSSRKVSDYKEGHAYIHIQRFRVQSSWSQHKHACVHGYTNILCHSLHHYSQPCTIIIWPSI